MSLTDAQLGAQFRAMVKAVVGEPLPIPAPTPIPTPTPEPALNRDFVLYYGNPLDDNFSKIVATKPAFVVLAGVYNRTITDRYHAAGTKAIAYIPTNYGNTDVSLRIKSAMDGGNDGVFFDEVAVGATSRNKANYDGVKSRGPEKIVIQNPGMSANLSSLFAVSDIVCVENQWFNDLKSYGQKPEKFMAVQGDPGKNADGTPNTDPRYQSADTLTEALKRLQAFRENGGQYYYSGYQNHHWMIQPFLADFAELAR